MTETESPKLGVDYIRSYTGIVKICQEVANLAGLISVSTAHTSPKGDAFLGISAFALVVTAFLIILHVGNLVSKINLPWTRLEFFWCLFIIILYMIVSPLIVSFNLDGYVAGAAFGFIAMLAYGADALVKFKYM